MIQPDDARLERELRGALDDRDPGPASHALRDRVDRIPDAPAERDRSRLLSALGGLGGLAGLAVAAAVVLVVMGHPGELVAPGVGAGPTGTLGPTFDPRMAGPGLVGAGIPTEWVVALLALSGVALVAFAMRLGGRRGFALIVAVVLVGVGVAQTLTADVGPGPVTSNRGVGVTFVAPPAGSSAKDVAYITAAPGEPFAFMVSISNDGSMPIRLLGLRDPAAADDSLAPSITAPVGPGITAVRRDTAPNGGTFGMDAAVPLTPIDLEPGEFVVLYVVGQAGQCAFGPTYDPSLGSTVGYTGLRDLEVVYSVYGMPRTATLEWPYDILEPSPDSACPPQP
ncbi:MAG TPA: hypothetical protein VIK13_03975 [Candidatus Limnocylindrales bacterium]